MLEEVFMNLFESTALLRHMPLQAGYVFLAIFTILVVATAIGKWLEFKKGSNQTIANLNARIYAWWLMTIVLFFCILVGASRCNCFVFSGFICGAA